MEKQKLPSVNGLRAISIIFVINYHLHMQSHFFNSLQSIKWLSPFLSLIQDGNLGVNIFFVISGFLITSLLLHEEERKKTISLKDFYIRRTLRIFPAYYFMLFVYLILQILNIIHISNASWLTAITYTKYFNWNLDTITAHAWSLSIEEHFYLFWPFVFICGNKFRKATAIVLVIAVCILRSSKYINTITWMNDLTIFKRIDSIAIGCIFALYKDEIIKKISTYWNILFSLAIIFLLYSRYLNDIIYYKIHPKLVVILIPFGTNYGTLANLAIAIIMMYSIFGPRNLWFKLLNLKILNYIGLISYSIYLWQELFIFGPKEYFVFNFPQNLIFILPMALFSYYVIEKPFLKLKSRFSKI